MISKDYLTKTFFTPEHNDISLRDMSELSNHWGWMLAASLCFIILGTVAFSMPLASSIGVTYGIAGLFLAGGAVHLIQAIQLSRKRGSLTRFFQSILSLVVGGLILRYPEGGMLSIAVALSFYFFISAAAQFILATSLRAYQGWGYLGALISFSLGVYIIFTFPFSAMWVPGTLLGVDLVFAGATLMGLAFTLRAFRNKNFNLSKDTVSKAPILNQLNQHS
jgi:uncharacterized membrane protein HdeD (DUF308 family)